MLVYCIPNATPTTFFKHMNHNPAGFASHVIRLSHIFLISSNVYRYIYTTFIRCINFDIINTINHIWNIQSNWFPYILPSTSSRDDWPFHFITAGYTADSRAFSFKIGSPPLRCYNLQQRLMYNDPPLYMASKWRLMLMRSNCVRRRPHESASVKEKIEDRLVQPRKSS